NNKIKDNFAFFSIEKNVNFNKMEILSSHRIGSPLKNSFDDLEITDQLRRDNRMVKRRSAHNLLLSYSHQLHHSNTNNNNNNTNNNINNNNTNTNNINNNINNNIVHNNNSDVNNNNVNNNSVNNSVNSNVNNNVNNNNDNMKENVKIIKDMKDDNNN